MCQTRAWSRVVQNAFNADHEYRILVLRAVPGKNFKNRGSGPDGGRAALDGWHGPMKPEERRKILAGGSALG